MQEATLWFSICFQWFLSSCWLAAIHSWCKESMLQCGRKPEVPCTLLKFCVEWLKLVHSWKNTKSTKYFFIFLPKLSTYLCNVKLPLCGYNEMRYLWKTVFEINVLFLLNADVETENSRGLFACVIILFECCSFAVVIFFSLKTYFKHAIENSFL